MTIRKDNGLIQERMSRILNLWPSLDDVNTLRRAAKTLHSWYEAECNGDIQRDEETGKPYRCSGMSERRYPTPDREAGAIRRIEEVCARLGLHYYLQTDPRGGTLYLSREPIPANNYSQAFFVA